MRRVAVTGLGLLTSIGNDVQSSWKNLISCKSGIRKINHFDVNNMPCKIAGYLSNNHDASDYFDINKTLEKKDLNRNDRFIQYGLIAAQSAIIDSGIHNLSEDKKLNVGVSVGSGIGGLETIYNNAIIWITK